MIIADQALAHFGGIAQQLAEPSAFPESVDLQVYHVTYPFFRIVVLLAALALFAAVTSVPRRRRPRDHRFWLYAYRAVAIFLAGSVTVGSGLADALPWQW